MYYEIGIGYMDLIWIHFDKLAYSLVFNIQLQTSATYFTPDWEINSPPFLPPLLPWSGVEVMISSILLSAVILANGSREPLSMKCTPTPLLIPAPFISCLALSGALRQQQLQHTQTQQNRKDAPRAVRNKSHGQLASLNRRSFNGTSAGFNCVHMYILLSSSSSS